MLTYACAAAEELLGTLAVGAPGSAVNNDLPLLMISSLVHIILFS
jgi:hypothetical protein